MLIQLSALIAENLDNQDLISSCVNIRYCGDYELEVFDANKKKVGEAMAPIVQMGVDYSSAYEFIYDYDMSDEEERQDLADSLGVESIPDEWLDDDGDIDTDEDGFMPLAKFAEKYQVRSSYGSLDSYGKILELDPEKPLSEMFEADSIKGWFCEEE
ncbi:MAG: hypothetical protein KBT20_05700 [Bacteroidales bacterium]|nr:hypothetical protein [Candidatus Liminaster caballi]